MALVEINGSVVDGRLCLTVSINRQMRHFEALKKWAYSLKELFATATLGLTKILEVTPTLSDFPLLDVSYDELEYFMDQLNQKGYKLGDITEILPCIPLQEGILLSVAKGSATYHIVQVWKCTESSDVPATAISVDRLESAWTTTMKRHSICSTIFLESTELQSFVQVQLKRSVVPIQRLHTEMSDPTDALLAMEVPKFHDAQPSFIITLCQAKNGQVACRLDVSHALIDAMSFPILLADVTEAYRSGQIGRPAPAYRSAIQEITRLPVDRKLDYWTHDLEDVKPCNIPMSCSENGQKAGSHKDIAISSSVTKPINAFCQKEGITRSTFFQVAWAMVLSQITSNEQDVCFGFLASGRDIPAEDADGIVGPLINMLVSRVKLNAPPSQVLAQVGKRTANHLEFQHTSLAKLQDRLNLRGRRLFNTGLTVRPEFRQQQGRGLRFHEAYGTDPTEV